jgi:hypothetical protein
VPDALIPHTIPDAVIVGLAGDPLTVIVKSIAQLPERPFEAFTFKVPRTVSVREMVVWVSEALPKNLSEPPTVKFVVLQLLKLNVTSKPTVVVPLKLPEADTLPPLGQFTVALTPGMVLRPGPGRSDIAGPPPL